MQTLRHLLKMTKYIFVKDFSNQKTSNIQVNTYFMLSFYISTNKVTYFNPFLFSSHQISILST